MERERLQLPALELERQAQPLEESEIRCLREAMALPHPVQARLEVAGRVVVRAVRGTTPAAPLEEQDVTVETALPDSRQATQRVTQGLRLEGEDLVGVQERTPIVPAATALEGKFQLPTRRLPLTIGASSG